MQLLKWIPLFCLVLFCGCGSELAAIDPRFQAAGTACLLVSEPEGGQGVLDVRENVAAGKNEEIVIVGKIGGVPDPWTPGKASFVIADPSLSVSIEGEEEHHHAPGHNCPYCSKKQEDNKESLALLEFVDDSGEIIPVDAQKLFALKPGQMIVAQGAPRLDELGYLTVTCKRLFVRK